MGRIDIIVWILLVGKSRQLESEKIKIDGNTYSPARRVRRVRMISSRKSSPSQRKTHHTPKPNPSHHIHTAPSSKVNVHMYTHLICIINTFTKPSHPTPHFRAKKPNKKKKKKKKRKLVKILKKHCIRTYKTCIVTKE